MQKSKLFLLLKNLDTEEMRWLAKFVRSPFYNSNGLLVQLFDLLRKYHPDLRSGQLEKEAVFQKLLPGEPFDVRRVDLLMSRLAGLVEQFLVARRLQREVFQYKKMLVEELGERDLYDFFEKGTDGLLADLEARPYRDEVYFREKYELNLRYFGHPGTGMHTDPKNALQGAVQYFEAYKKLAGLKLKCASNAQADIMGNAKNATPENPDRWPANPVFVLYDKLEKLQRSHGQGEDFQALFDYFRVHIGALNWNDRSNILKILLNHSNRLINKGETAFGPISLELYKLGLEHHALLIYGKLQESIFHNIVTIGTFCREFDWTKNFMETYQNLLEEHTRKEAMALGMGQWHFEKKEYWEAIEILKFPFHQPQDIVKSKSLTIRAWSELFWKDDSYFELLAAQLEAFEKHIRRHREIGTNLSEGSLKFIAYCRKMALLRLEKKSFETLKPDILMEQNLLLKNWLLKMMEI